MQASLSLSIPPTNVRSLYYRLP